MTTHHMDEAEQLCDRLVVMDGGRIVAHGAPQQLIAAHSSREVLELRFRPGTQGPAEQAAQSLVERIEVLPDRCCCRRKTATPPSPTCTGSGCAR